MFKKNTKHLQPDIFGMFNSLPSKMQEKIKQSEEHHFYKLIFSKIDEKIFSILYSDKKSRPNSAINAMVSSLILMSRRQWTYEELFKQIQFNILVRVALGLDSIDAMPFSPATLFNFQNRINDHFVRNGENLLEQVFDNLTTGQLKALKLKTNIQRTDSFAAASNIRNYSRLQLLVELIIRIWRILSDEHKEQFSSHFENYTGKTSGQYIYSLSSAEFPKELDKIGLLYHWIDKNLKPSYAGHDVFRTFERVYSEHFSIIDDKISVKKNDELTSSSLQSPDDLDAAYRLKNREVTKGQSINVTETAHPDNPINLVSDVDVNPVNKDDSIVLNKRIDRIKDKTPDLDELHFDGAYGSAENDLKFEEHKITPVQTAVRGAKSAVDIEIEKESDGQYTVSCPNQTVGSVKARKRYKAEFNLQICNRCPLKEECSTIAMKKCRVFYFAEKAYLAKKRQKTVKTIPPERRQLRNNVEATVNEFTCRLRKKKLKVRGLFKTSVFAYSVAISVNFGRIYRLIATDPVQYACFLCSFSRIFKDRLQNMVSNLRFYKKKSQLMSMTNYCAFVHQYLMF
ncbi:MAG: transposase [Candidatus Omnitrophica bacterium]|nr:transposase [Candidatus Omnitrophota bacterium]